VPRAPDRIKLLIGGTVILLSLAFVGSASIFVPETIRADDQGELIEFAPLSATDLVYCTGLKEGMKPLLQSDFYRKVKKLTLFSESMKSDVSAPLLSLWGDAEEALGMKLTLKRVLFIVGDEALVYETPFGGGVARGAVIKTGWKGFLVDTIARLSGRITREELEGFSPWVATVGTKKIYFVRVGDYTLFSDIPPVLLDQWRILAGEKGETLATDPVFATSLKTITDSLAEEYHLLVYHKTVLPAPYEKGLAKRMERILGDTGALFVAVSLREGGADVSVLAPYSPKGESGYLPGGVEGSTPGENAGGLDDLGGRRGDAPLDVASLPGETAALVLFPAFDPEILYPHFYQNWFSDVGERIAYVSVLKKWKNDIGFDLEEGVIRNIDRGAFFALGGMGYEGREPHLRTMASFAVEPGAEETVVSHLSAVMDYALRDEGPNFLSYEDKDVYYWGEFRGRELSWSGREYVEEIAANPGFAVGDNRLSLFRDITALTQMTDEETLSYIRGHLSGEFPGIGGSLLETPAFVEAQKDLPLMEYDLALFVSGENIVSMVETYLVNLSDHYRYFLYQDAEKRFIPFLEYMRKSFVSFYGGVNFTEPALSGQFRLSVRDGN
jgi:hypothetical protein